jgi:hypothetical protein
MAAQVMDCARPLRLGLYFLPEREGGRLYMKGSKAILVLATLVLILGTSSTWAQSEYAIARDQTIGPGHETLKFERIVYTFTASSCYSVGFQKLDVTHVALHIKPLSKAKRFEVVVVQWSSFEPQEFVIEGPGGDTIIINTETGYAEK